MEDTAEDTFIFKSKTLIPNILLNKSKLTEQKKISHYVKISCHAGPK